MSLFGKITYTGYVTTCECGAANWRITLEDNKLTAWCAGFKGVYANPCKRRYEVVTTCSGLIFFINPHQEDQCEKTIVEDAESESWEGEDAAENASSGAAPSASRLTPGPASTALPPNFEGSYAGSQPHRKRSQE